MKKNPFTLPNKVLGSLLLAIGCITSSVVPMANANLIVNGDFETGMPSPWTGALNTIPGFYIVGWPGYHSGLYAAGLIGHGGQAVAIGQSIPSLVVGQSYTIDFYYKPTGMADLNVTLGGATDTLAVGASSSWLHYMNTLTVTSGTTFSIEQDPNGLNWFYVDDVNVELVTVPDGGSSAVLLSLVCAGVFALRHRLV